MPEIPRSEEYLNPGEHFFREVGRLLHEMSSGVSEQKLKELSGERNRLFANATDDDLFFYAEKLYGLNPKGPTVKELFDSARIRRESIRQGKNMSEMSGTMREETEKSAYDKAMAELDKSPRELGEELSQSGAYHRAMKELEKTPRELGEDLQKK